MLAKRKGKTMTLNIDTALRTFAPEVAWCDECVTYGDACYDCAVTAEMMED